MTLENHCGVFLPPQMNANGNSQPMGFAQGPAGDTAPTGGAPQGHVPLFLLLNLITSAAHACPSHPSHELNS